MRLLRDQSNATVTGASTKILPENPRRKGVIISCPAVASVWVSFVGDAAVGRGIRLPPGGAPLVLVAEWAASVLTEQISAISTGAAENVGVVDIFE